MRPKSSTFYGVFCLALFVSMSVVVLLISLFIPRVRIRRALARRACRVFFRLVGVSFEVTGLEMLPARPCVVVANHASYLDGPVMAAALPPEFAFVIKKEMVRVPLVSALLRRLGSEFVERFDRHKSAVDARRVLRRAAAGQSLVFFPEGTFNGVRAIGKFHAGAFTTATRNGMPVVAVAVHGTRAVLPSGTLLMHRVAIRVQILGVIAAPDLRDRAREMIASAVGESLAA